MMDRTYSAMSGGGQGTGGPLTSSQYYKDPQQYVYNNNNSHHQSSTSHHTISNSNTSVPDGLAAHQQQIAYAYHHGSGTSTIEAISNQQSAYQQGVMHHSIQEQDKRLVALNTNSSKSSSLNTNPNSHNLYYDTETNTLKQLDAGIKSPTDSVSTNKMLSNSHHSYKMSTTAAHLLPPPSGLAPTGYNSISNGGYNLPTNGYKEGAFNTNCDDAASSQYYHHQPYYDHQYKFSLAPGGAITNNTSGYNTHPQYNGRSKDANGAIGASGFPYHATQYQTSSKLAGSYYPEDFAGKGVKMHPQYMYPANCYGYSPTTTGHHPLPPPPHPTAHSYGNQNYCSYPQTPADEPKLLWDDYQRDGRRFIATGSTSGHPGNNCKSNSVIKDGNVYNPQYFGSQSKGMCALPNSPRDGFYARQSAWPLHLPYHYQPPVSQSLIMGSAYDRLTGGGYYDAQNYDCCVPSRQDASISAGGLAYPPGNYAAQPSKFYSGQQNLYSPTAHPAKQRLCILNNQNDHRLESNGQASYLHHSIGSNFDSILNYSTETVHGTNGVLSNSTDVGGTAAYHHSKAGYQTVVNGVYTTGDHNSKDIVIKSTNLREFLATWNEDEDECTEQRIADGLEVKGSAATIYYKDEVTGLHQFPYKSTPASISGNSSRPKIHVGITVDGDVTNSQFINLPDIIIDIEKSKDVDPTSQIFDINMQQQQLQQQQQPIQNNIADNMFVLESHEVNTGNCKLDSHYTKTSLVEIPATPPEYCIEKSEMMRDESLAEKRNKIDSKPVPKLPVKEYVALPGENLKTKIVLKKTSPSIIPPETIMTPKQKFIKPFKNLHHENSSSVHKLKFIRQRIMQLRKLSLKKSPKLRKFSINNRQMSTRKRSVSKSSTDSSLNTAEISQIVSPKSLSALVIDFVNTKKFRQFLRPDLKIEDTLKTESDMHELIPINDPLEITEDDITLLAKEFQTVSETQTGKVTIGNAKHRKRRTKRKWKHGIEKTKKHKNKKLHTEKQESFSTDQKSLTSGCSDEIDFEEKIDQISKCKLLRSADKSQAAFYQIEDSGLAHVEHTDGAINAKIIKNLTSREEFQMNKETNPTEAPNAEVLEKISCEVNRNIVEDTQNEEDNVLSNRKEIIIQKSSETVEKFDRSPKLSNPIDGENLTTRTESSKKNDEKRSVQDLSVLCQVALQNLLNEGYLLVSLEDEEQLSTEAAIVNANPDSPIQTAEAIEDDRNSNLKARDINRNVTESTGIGGATDENNTPTCLTEGDDLQNSLDYQGQQPRSKNTDGNNENFCADAEEVQTFPLDLSAECSALPSPATTPPPTGTNTNDLSQKPDYQTVCPSVLISSTEPLQPGGMKDKGEDDESHIIVLSPNTNDFFSLHHEEIVPDNLKLYKTENLRKYLQEKYVQKNFKTILHNLIIQKIFKKYLNLTVFQNRMLRKRSKNFKLKLRLLKERLKTLPKTNENNAKPSGFNIENFKIKSSGKNE